MEQNSQNNPPQNYQPSSVPPPPQSDVSVRTMQSDVKSMQEQGGATPVPEQVSPSFQASATETPEPQPKKSKRWVWFLLFLLLVGGAGYYLYFINPSILGLGGEEELAPEEAVSGAEKGTAQQETPPPSAGIDLSALNSALKNEAAQVLPSGNLKEIALVNEQSASVSWPDLLSAVLPDLANSEFMTMMKGNFQNDFKAYLYYDDNGVWPAYTVELKPESALDIIALRSGLAALENSLVSNFYIDSPGASGIFNDGQIDGVPTRYAKFSQPGASFNYGVFGNQLIISASYDGLKKVLE